MANKMASSHIGLGDASQQHKKYAELHQRGLSSVKHLKSLINKPSYDKENKTFNLSEVSRLINVSRSTIKDNEMSGHLEYSDGTKQKSEYNLDDIKIIRNHFKKGFFNGSTKRPDNLSPLTIAMAMFKGGVGKTTHATHLATHCAIHGLNTLLIDLDPQASATLTLGYIPSVDLIDGETMLNALLDDPNEISNIIKRTHYHGLDIVTSGLELQSADLVLPNPYHNNEEKLGAPLLRLKESLLCLTKYDVVILDCPPNHGATTMNALTAADGIILPITPTMLAYGSSIQFIQTLKELTGTLEKYQNNTEKMANQSEVDIIKNLKNQLFRVLITNDERNDESQDATAAIRGLYQNYVLPRPMVHSIALPRTSNDLALLYDIKRAQVRGSKESFDRGLACMKDVNDDILLLLAKLWEL